MRSFFLSGLLATLFFFSTGATMAAAAPPLPVVVSITPQKYMLERIAGGQVSVTVLVKPGADPHSYEPTPAQMRKCAAARIYFTIGVPFEDAWLPRLKGTAKNLEIISSIRDVHRKPITDTHSEEDGQAEKEHSGAPEEHEHGGASDVDDYEHGGAPDPHVWLSPLLVKYMLPVVVEALSAAMPERAEEFRSNAAVFSKDLDAVYTEMTSEMSSIPREKRVFLTFHPSWGYLAQDLGATELCIEVDGKEPGPKAMKAIIDTAREHSLNTIFVEPQFPTAAAEAVAENITAKVVRLDPLAENLLENWRHVAKELAASFPR